MEFTATLAPWFVSMHADPAGVATPFVAMASVFGLVLFALLAAALAYVVMTLVRGVRLITDTKRQLARDMASRNARARHAAATGVLAISSLVLFGIWLFAIPLAVQCAIDVWELRAH